MPFLLTILSIVILGAASSFLTFTKLVLLYFVLSSLVTILLLGDIPRATMGGRCGPFGTACINNRFAVINWKRFLISFAVLIFISIPLLLMVMITEC